MALAYSARLSRLTPDGLANACSDESTLTGQRDQALPSFWSAGEATCAEASRLRAACHDLFHVSASPDVRESSVSSTSPPVFSRGCEQVLQYC